MSLLSSLGLILGISEGILGLTVLSWGNSVGDLVADVAVARDGMASMAIAGTYAGPMFNLMIGLGLSLVLYTWKYDESVIFANNTTLPVLMFATLLISLLMSAIAIPVCGFKLRRELGYALIALYFVFLLLAMLIEFGVIPKEF